MLKIDRTKWVDLLFTTIAQQAGGASPTSDQAMQFVLVSNDTIARRVIRQRFQELEHTEEKLNLMDFLSASVRIFEKSANRSAGIAKFTGTFGTPAGLVVAASGIPIGVNLWLGSSTNGAALSVSLIISGMLVSAASAIASFYFDEQSKNRLLDCRGCSELLQSLENFMERG